MPSLKRLPELAVVVAIVIAAFFWFDRREQTLLDRSRAETQKQFVADLAAALQKVQPPPADDTAIPPVTLVFHSNPMPRGTGQLEIFNLASSPAYADASGTRVTGELINGTPRHFALVVVGLVALDSHGKVTRRQPILFSALAAGERRAFETTLSLPMDQFAAHRFELDTAR
jgi:hypothetical protein